MYGKKYQESKKLIEKEFYGLDEAIALLKKSKVAKFDSSCEVHLNLGLDPKQAEQNIRSTVALPHGTGKDVRVVAFVDDGLVKEAKDAGAIEAGTEELVKKIEGGWLDFDVAVASPDQMKSLGKIAKTLGQKRLMPSPKSGTVTPEVVKTIGELKKGKVEVRLDKLANVHNIFGKISFDDANLKENLVVILKKIKELKPDDSKGVYFKSITITSTMGPGIALDISKVMEEL